jgi:PhnB protein
MRYSESPGAPSVPPGFADRVCHSSLYLGIQRITGADDPSASKVKHEGFSLALHLDDPAEADRIFGELAVDGQVQVPIEETFWAARYGMLTDCFGVPWMISSGRGNGLGSEVDEIRRERHLCLMCPENRMVRADVYVWGIRKGCRHGANDCGRPPGLCASTQFTATNWNAEATTDSQSSIRAKSPLKLQERRIKSLPATEPDGARTDSPSASDKQKLSLPANIAASQVKRLRQYAHVHHHHAFLVFCDFYARAAKEFADNWQRVQHRNRPRRVTQRRMLH